MGADGLIIGLDVAGNTGIAEGIPGSTPHLYSQRFLLEDDNPPIQAFGRATAWAARRYREINPIAVFVEATIPDTALHGRTHHNAQMIKLGLYACLTGIAVARGIPVFAVNIAKYRKAFTGHGGLTGADGKRFVRDQCRLLGWDPPDLDASDAAAVWSWGCSQSSSLFQTKMQF